MAHFVPSRGTQYFLCRAVAHIVPSSGTFCAVPWHISLFVLCCGTFCDVLWHILCLPVAHKPKSIFLPCYGTFCAFPWHILCLPVAHGILFPLAKNCKSRIASQELQVKNCKSRDKFLYISVYLQFLLNWSRHPKNPNKSCSWWPIFSHFCAFWSTLRYMFVFVVRGVWK
jgi:hypothetical protein